MKVKTEEQAEYRITTQYDTKTPKSKPRISCSKDAYEIAREHCKPELFEEHFYTMYLNNKNEVLDVKLIAIGAVNECQVSPLPVFRPVFELHGCTRIILVHNHPSGDPTPSPHDVELTKRLVRCAKLLGFDVLDHIVIGADSYSSLKDLSMF